MGQKKKAALCGAAFCVWGRYRLCRNLCRILCRNVYIRSERAVNRALGAVTPPPELFLGVGCVGRGGGVCRIVGGNRRARLELLDGDGGRKVAFARSLMVWSSVLKRSLPMMYTYGALLA